MRVIGFNFTKIYAEKHVQIQEEFSITTNIDIINLEKEKIDVLKADEEVLKARFKLNIEYLTKEKKEQKVAEIIFEGEILLLGPEEEIKDILKNWKKKEMPVPFKAPLFNLILKRCTPKAVHFEEELNLPFHIPLPQFRPDAPEKK
jgi:hypothetical protein